MVELVQVEHKDHKVLQDNVDHQDLLDHKEAMLVINCDKEILFSLSMDGNCCRALMAEMVMMD